MDLHEFRLGGRLALTDDVSGTKLPENGWVFVQTLKLDRDHDRVGASFDEVKKSIKDRGFFVWPVED